MQSVFSVISPYLFPLFCVSCDAEGGWVCQTCFEHHLYCRGVFYCPVCHTTNKDGSVCASCLNASFLSHHVALLPYKEDTVIAAVLHALKYQYAESVISVLEMCVRQFLTGISFGEGVDMIVPVPLHKKRFCERGFNQAEKIACLLSSQTGIPLAGSVRRTRETIQQATLAKDDRENNVRDAFIADSDVAGKTMLLVDDVFTTGSTMQECAKALKRAGAREVRGFSIARG